MLDEARSRMQDVRVARTTTSTPAMRGLYKRKRRRSPLSKSEQMARVSKTATTPEMILRRTLWARGFRFRVKSRLPGTPDLFFGGPRVAIFVDGCFWHGCPDHGSIPSSNIAYWEPKLRRNQERDARVNLELRAAGWAVLRFWEHEIADNIDAVVQSIREAMGRAAAGEATPALKQRAGRRRGPQVARGCRRVDERAGKDTVPPPERR